MKLLRNPVVVGLLALVAFGLVGNSIYQGMRRSPRRAAPAGVPTPAPVAAVPAAPRPAPATNAALGQSEASTNALLEQPSPLAAAAVLPPLDLDIIHADAPRWAQGRRDPFQIRSLPEKPVYPPAREFLTLSAVWRQTDSSLAVLNNRIYAAGDSVLRYTIKSIEPDRVWVQGPNGLELVEFISTIMVRTNLSPRPAPLGAQNGAPNKP